MPAGKEIASFDGNFSSVRVLEVGENSRVLEGNYAAKISGQLSGRANGSITFDGSAERGTVKDIGFGILASGDVVNARGQGVYWSNGEGTWEVRSAYLLGDQAVVSEGQVIMSGEEVLLKGKIYELT